MINMKNLLKNYLRTQEERVKSQSNLLGYFVVNFCGKGALRWETFLGSFRTGYFQFDEILLRYLFFFLNFKCMITVASAPVQP